MTNIDKMGVCDRINRQNNNLLLCFCIYCLTIFVYKDFNIPSILGYVLLLVAIIYSFSKTNFTIYFNKMNLAFLFFSIVQVFFIGLAALTGNTSDLMLIPTLALCNIMVFLSLSNRVEIKKVETVWIVVSIAISFYVLLTKYFSDSFIQFAKKYLSEESGERAINAIERGYGVVIGSNLELIDYILAFAVMILVARIAILGMQSNSLKTDLFFLAIVFFAIVIENKKAELLCVVIAVALLILSNMVSNSSAQKMKRIIVSGAMVFLAGIIFVVLYKYELLGRYGDFISTVIDNIKGGNADITSGRGVMWRTAFELFKDNPLFGIGWGGFEEYVLGSTQLGAEYTIRHVHNCYLQLLCETGLIGSILYLTLMFYMVRKTVKRTIWLKKNENLKRLHIISTACVGYQFFFLLEGILNPCWYKIVFLFFFTLTIMISNGCMVEMEHVNRYKMQTEQEMVNTDASV